MEPTNLNAADALMSKNASTVHQFEATEMIALGLIVLAAHLGGKVCRRYKMSEVTGQIVGGAVVGPLVLSFFDILPQYYAALGAFHFFIFLFLSLVAFGVGEELHISRLKQIGSKALWISMVHAAITCPLITCTFHYLAGFTWLESLVFGSTGIASAPAVTFVLMNQLRIEGRLRHLMGSVVVLVDLVEVLLFSFVVQVMLKLQGGEDFSSRLALPVLEEVALAMLLAFGVYVCLRVLVRRQASENIEEEEREEMKIAPDAAFLQRILAEHPSPSAEVFITILGCIAVGTGIAYLHEIPFLITAIGAGFLVANFHSHALFDSLKIENITPILNLAFFALMGASLPFSEFRGDMIAYAGLYVLTRFSGKFFGTWLGCYMAGEEIKIARCLPYLLLPQAGVSAVEAVFASAILGDPRYAAIILPAIVFFQITGVWLADRSLRTWRSWVTDEEKALKAPAPASGRGEAARKLLARLDENFITLELNDSTKNQLIATLVDHARRSSDQHIDRAQAIQVLNEREKLAPTGFGHGIALPHCRLMGIDHPVLVLGRHENGIVFGGVDNSPCHLILLILSAARNPGEHLKLLAATAHVLGDEGTRGEFMSAQSPAEIMGILRRLADEAATT